MRVEVSIGEVIDKYSILEIKKEKISNQEKKRDVEKELFALQSCKDILSQYSFFYKLLVWVNKYIWETTDRIKELQPDHDDFSNLAHTIFEMNQVRFRLKKYFNTLCSSNIQEHKSYSESHCVICIENEQALYAKIPEINFLCISYDTVSFEYSDIETIRLIFKNPNIIYDTIPESGNRINIESYSFSATNRDYFWFEPLIYVCTGMLGDFVHQLSVINEKFRTTGRKGILYLYGTAFGTGLQQTYRDTYNIIKEQIYIESYHMIKNGQVPHYDFNLSEWRQSQHLYKANWSIIFNSQYNIKWGTNKWLSLPVMNDWQDKIVISVSISRFVPNINYTKIYETYKDKLVFVTQNVNEYNYFITNSGINIPIYTPSTLYEHWTIINSCKKYIGNLSSPLAVAIALYKPVDIIINKEHADSVHMLGLKDVIHTITYIYN